MAKTNQDRVTFLNADGEEISNDPRWLAEKVLADAGVETSGPTALEQDQAAEIERLKAALAAAEKSPEIEDEENPQGDYSEVKGQALVNLAKEREISLKHEDGSALKAGEVRAALIAQDQAAAE